MTIETSISRALQAAGLHIATRSNICKLELFWGMQHDRRLRPVSHYRKGGWSRYNDYRVAVLSILTFIECEHTIGNDAPRGGKTGAWITFNRLDFFEALQKKTGYVLPPYHPLLTLVEEHINSNKAKKDLEFTSILDA